MSTRPRVLLTGGSGMVGRNLAAHPRAAQIELIAPSHAQLDLADADATARAVRELRPDLIVHAAGVVGGIAANLREPVRFLVANADIGRNVVLAARAAGVPRLLNLASSCIYPRGHEDALREEQVLSGELEPSNEGYALAKILTLRLAEYVTREQPELQYKTVIPCNLYGAWDTFDPARSHLVPAIIDKLHRALRDGRDVVDIWGDGQARREFMYAGDLADALLRAVAHFDTLPPLMNLGVGHDHTIDDYYAAAADVIGWRGRFEHDLSRPVGMRRKRVDTQRQRAWGWQPTTTLADGLAATYRHYLQEHAR